MFETAIVDQFSALRHIVGKDLQRAEQLIRDNLQSNIPLINQISEHIIQSGGKRLRMLLVLLSAKAFGYEGFAHIQLAAIIELFHTATLLHDDVVDSSHLRRGRPTANTVWGDHASVLVGDYLYSRAFQLIVQTNDMVVMDILAQSSNKMAEGEVLQLMNCHNPDVSQEKYMQVIEHKTATLFAAAAQMGAVLTRRSPEEIQAMYCYGVALGAAFQLVDDALDYCASAEQMGKNIGEDLAEGKPTLPYIRALEKTTPAQAESLRQAIREGKTENIAALLKIVESTDAIVYTYQCADKHAAQALRYLDKLPASIYRDGLQQLVEFAVARHY